MLLALAEIGLRSMVPGAEETAELAAAEVLESFVPDTHRLVRKPDVHAVRFDGSRGHAAQIIAWAGKDVFGLLGQTSTDADSSDGSLVLSLWEEGYGESGFDKAEPSERLLAWAGDIIVMEEYSYNKRTYSERQFEAAFGEKFAV
ncbi:hypothetical protein GY24_10230 [Microterricola pindariensis]|uniref:Uncharacterized protein n=2 Tax=Microterricola pindariensis TaxID=478010 RepID=A0ABX5AUN2_9MICO|nr:hypothetical protein GY24_10230 [Microterricola pindariensis]